MRRREANLTRGPGWLLAAIIVACGACEPPRPAPYSHELHLDETPREFEGVHESPVIESRRPFNEVLLSWNVDRISAGGFSVEIRVGRQEGDSWSPYLYVGEGGKVPPSLARKTSFDGGRIDVDYFRSEKRFDRIRYRVTAFASGAAAAGGVQPQGRLRLVRAAVCFSDTTGTPLSLPAAPRARAVNDPPADDWQRRLPVPFRSQKMEDASVAGRICSPTSVAMVMAYRGVDRPTAEIAARVFDPVHDIYGNWPRAVQAAYELGVPGYLARFSRWSDVHRMIAAGQPLIISVRCGPGELTGAPYPSTKGHLMVLAGFDKEGNVLCNDPAAPSAERGQCTYLREEIEKVWMGRGGTAYVLLPRREAP